MLSLNRVQIIGNLTRDPELRYTPNGQAVASFAVATNRVYTDANGEKKETVEFHDIVTWAKLAEICNQLLSKGRKVYVEGRMQTRKWEGQDGVTRYKTEIIAENMLVLDRPKEWGAPGGYNAPANTSAPIEEPISPIESGASSLSDESIRSDDIPF